MRRIPGAPIDSFRPPTAGHAPAHRLAACIKRLGDDRFASVALEFAFIAPAFIALLFGALQVALIYLAQEGLETAVENSARLIMTGTAQTMTLTGKTSAGLAAADFKTAVCNGISGTDVNGNAVSYPAALPPLLSCSRVAVNVEIMPAGCTAPNISAPTYTYTNGNLTNTGSGYGASNCAGTTNTNNGLSGTQGQLVVVQLSYLWPTISAPLGFNFVNQPNGNRLLLATYVVTVENYVCATGVSTC